MRKTVILAAIALLSLPAVLHVAKAEQYTVTLNNSTGLPAAKYSLYAVGYSAAGRVMLNSTGSFVPITESSGRVTGLKIGSGPGELAAITLDTASPFAGGIVLIAAVPAGSPAPYVLYSNGGADVVAPQNPPSDQWPDGQGRYIFQFIELTQPADKAPTIDVSVVNGFVMPITATVSSSLQVGQPLPRGRRKPVVTRASILAAYRPFLAAEKITKPLRNAYSKLLTASGKLGKQTTAIINPGLYPAAGANGASILNTVWNADLQTLFQTSGRAVGMIGDDGAYYKGMPTNIGGYWVLDFLGYTDAACTQPNGNHYRVYSPLTPDPAGAYQTNESAGCMVFANDGVFADASANAVLAGPAFVALGLQRDIVAALNRGVALRGGTDGLRGSNSQYWGIERNWYPARSTYNVFSRFMHTASVGTQKIFVLPRPAVKDAQGSKMGQSYGFGYDESPVHSTPGQPNVPSKFDPVPNTARTIALTFGPWR